MKISPIRRVRMGPLSIICLVLSFCAASSLTLAKEGLGDEANDKAVALSTLRARQATITKILPDLEAATVCMQAGGGSGSGVIVNRDGLILTAAHVVEGQTQMTIRFSDGREGTAKVLGSYRPADAAMAQMIEEGPYAYAECAPLGSLDVGQTILATGHPSGYDEQRGIPLRIGHIISFDQAGMFASDAPLIGGDSGGPSFNLDGQVVGIHSNISGDVSVNNDAGIDAYLENWESMLAGEIRGGELMTPEEAEERVVFGVKVIGSGEGEPVRVRDVAKDTPADWAGLKANDVIVEVEGRVPTSAPGFMQQVLGETYGREFTLKIRRDEEELSLDVRLLIPSEIDQEIEKRQAGGDDESGEESGTTQDSPKPDERIPLIMSPNRDATDEEAEESKSDLQRLLERSRESNGRLKVDREQLKEFRDMLGKRVDALAPVGSRRRDEWGTEFQDAFAVHTARYSRSTFPLFVSGRHVAMALVVDERGYLLSKASEVEGRGATVHLTTDSKVPAEVIAIERDLDVVLLKIDPQEIILHPVRFRDPAGSEITEPPKGTLCCSVGSDPEFAAGVGVVSVAARALDGNTSAYLGVAPEDAKSGARLTEVTPNGPADRAGLKMGDIVESLDGEMIGSAEDLSRAVESRPPDDKVSLNIRRGDSWLTLPVVLGDKSKVAPMPGAREQGTDGMSTAMSRRRWNFPRGIQHDCGIQPKQCGGVLVDLDGTIIGLNIARAGRIKSYAIPAPLIHAFVESNLASATDDGEDH